MATAIRRVNEHLDAGRGGLGDNIVAGLMAAGAELQAAPRGHPPTVRESGYSRTLVPADLSDGDSDTE